MCTGTENKSSISKVPAYTKKVEAWYMALQPTESSKIINHQATYSIKMFTVAWQS
jgi:hypothetical protein